MGKSRSLEMSP